MDKKQIKGYVTQATKDGFLAWVRENGFSSESEALDALAGACIAGKIKYKPGSFTQR